MDFKVIFAQRAIKDLSEISAYIARENPEAAIELGNHLIDLANGLRLFPFRYPKSAHHPHLRKIASPPFLIYYRIDELDRVVTVRRFWHSARQPPTP